MQNPSMLNVTSITLFQKLSPLYPGEQHMISAIQTPNSVFSMISYKTARPKQIRADHPSSIKNIGILYTIPQNKCANDHQSSSVVLEEVRLNLSHRKSHMYSGQVCLLSHHLDSLLIYINNVGFYTRLLNFEVRLPFL